MSAVSRTCPSIKVVCVQILKVCACLIRTVMLLHTLFVGLGIVFHRLSSPTSAHQQYVYVSKQVKPKSQSLRFFSCSHFQKPVFNKAYHANPGMCKCAWSNYFGRSQIYLATVKHLFSSNYCDNNLASFLRNISNLLCMLIDLITDTLHIQIAVERW